MRRRIILSTAAMLGVAGLLGTAPAEALPSCGYTKSCITTYYTDSWLGSAVGQRGVACNNRTVYWGVTTPYSRYTERSCLN